MGYKYSDQNFKNEDATLFGALKEAADRFPGEPAIGYFGRTFVFSQLTETIEATAKGLLAAGVAQRDRVTFMLPNCPQAVAVFYAISRIGAVANMIHPLSSAEEITYFLDKADSRCIVTLDSFCDKVQKAAEKSKNDVQIIYTSVAEYMPLLIKIGYVWKTRRNKPHIPEGENLCSLESLIKRGEGRALPDVVYKRDSLAVILYSGGSTGLPKGICLSDNNMNALGIQVANAAGYPVAPGFKFLSAMPFFHGFGLGVGLHTILCNGAQSILVPQFTLDSYVSTLLKEKTNMLAIVPSMLEAFLRTDAFDGKDLSFLQGIFGGADSVSVSLLQRMDVFLKEHGCSERVREGYGLTEAVTCCLLNPKDLVKAGSIGLPLGDMECKIVKPGTFEELPVGEHGELILSGPTVMLGYLDDPEETAKALRQGPDGKRWLFSGDLCYTDADGYFYFVQRLKRLIITNGYNVSPVQVENVIAGAEGVDAVCVVGVKDPLSGQRITACVVPHEGADTKALRREILRVCKERLADYAVPVKIVFLPGLPLTKMGKVDYMRIEKEQNQISAGGKSDA